MPYTRNSGYQLTNREYRDAISSFKRIVNSIMENYALDGRCTYITSL